MAVCCCALAGTVACQHCSNNTMATDVWTNTVTTDHTESKPFGDGLDVCPVCGKPSTILKPMTNADRLRSMSDEELSKFCGKDMDACPPGCDSGKCIDELYAHGEGPYLSDKQCMECWLDWLRMEAQDG